MTDMPIPAEGGAETTNHRPLYLIAGEIGRDWIRPNLAALPYLYAMRHLNQITDFYGLDSGTNCIVYFLANAQTWRGEAARRIKSELREILKGAGYV